MSQFKPLKSTPPLPAEHHPPTSQPAEPPTTSRAGDSFDPERSLMGDFPGMNANAGGNRTEPNGERRRPRLRWPFRSQYRPGSGHWPV